MITAAASTLPQTENDNRPARPTYYQTGASAEAAARRLARAESPSQMITGVPFVRGVFRAVEGGKAFEVRISDVDYEVREVPAPELSRRTEEGKRAAVRACYAKAAELDQAATRCKIAGLAKHQRAEAERQRANARDIESSLTVAVCAQSSAGDR